ncbi:hypothetical protein KP509_38G018000 [Ceratopteris richardii]|nr:hypothetical protein KP509_38G018000 [Ceratopteris richardii]
MSLEMSERTSETALNSTEFVEAPALVRAHHGLHHRHHNHYHHHEVLVRSAQKFVTMGALDVLRESITVLRANSSTLMSLMLLLICPVSGLLLSHALLHGKISERVSARLYAAAGSVGLLHYLSLVKSTYTSLLQVLLSYVFAAPVLFTVWLLAKGGIIFVVSGTYANKSVSLYESLTAGVRLWKRIFSTYAWNSLILLGFATITATIFLLVVSVLDRLQFSADLIFLMELALGIFYSVVFAQILVVGSLANVVSALEEHYGLPALSRAFHLIKGKIQVALSLFCGSLLGAYMVETLYGYRVLGIPPSRYAINTASRMWEGPLLIFMYSFLLLLDTIVGCVFYFSCKSCIIESSEEMKHTINEENSSDSYV